MRSAELKLTSDAMRKRAGQLVVREQSAIVVQHVATQAASNQNLQSDQNAIEIAKKRKRRAEITQIREMLQCLLSRIAPLHSKRRNYSRTPSLECRHHARNLACCCLRTQKRQSFVCTLVAKNAIWKTNS